MPVVMYFIVGIGGVILGSFLNVCIWRIPKQMSISFPPSHCTACGHRLGAMDLIPLLSYILLHGRCRYCSKKISFRYFAVEFMTGALFVITYAVVGLRWLLLPYLALFAILIAISFIDAKHQIIPNGLVLAGLVPGLFVVVFQLNGPWWSGLLGAVCGIAPLLIIELLSRFLLKKEGMGGGDMKLMGMAGLYLGWKLTLTSLVFGVFLGGISGLTLLALGLKRRGDQIAFGPFLAIGIIVAALWGELILNWYFSLFA